MYSCWRLLERCTVSALFTLGLLNILIPQDLQLPTPKLQKLQFWYVLNPTFQTDSNLSCSDALFVARHGSIVVPLGTFAVPAYGALCGCGCRGLVLGFHIEPGLHHAAPDESLESECEIQGMEILPFSCFEKVSWLCSSSHGLSHFKPLYMISVISVLDVWCWAILLCHFMRSGASQLHEDIWSSLAWARLCWCTSPVLLCTP